jgi:hypothetical protein
MLALIEAELCGGRAPSSQADWLAIVRAFRPAPAAARGPAAPCRRAAELMARAGGRPYQERLH